MALAMNWPRSSRPAWPHHQEPSLGITVKTVAALALATLLAAPQAQAALMTPMALPSATQQSLAGASLPAADTDWTNTLQVQQFNSSLGTLNSVSITLSGRVHSEFSATNNTNGPAAFNNQLYGSLQGLLPGGSTLELLFEGADDRTLDGGASYAGVVVERDRSKQVTFTSGLSPFIGNGSFAIDLMALAWSTIDGPSDYDMDISTWSSASVDVVYDYTAATQNVPEPGALALVGLALAAVALTRRRAA